jgi:hypothetical protein
MLPSSFQVLETGKDREGQVDISIRIDGQFHKDF